jgi:hypothetical protein
MAVPERWTASAASCANAGEYAEAQGGSSGPLKQVAAPVPAPVAATRAAVRTFEVITLWSRSASENSMMPKSMRASSGSTRANSSAAAPPSPRPLQRTHRPFTIASPEKQIGRPGRPML